MKGAAASGALGYALVQVAASLGYKLPASVSELIPLAIAILGGYVLKSNGVTTTFSNDSGTTSSTTGPAVARRSDESRPLTGAIPVPVTPPVTYSTPLPEPDPEPEVPDIAPQSFTEVVTDDNATKVYSPGAAFWQARAESGRPGFDAPGN